MTKEEAINDLKDFIDTYLTVHGEEDTIAVLLDNVDVGAFHMAIKALEQEPKIGHKVSGDLLGGLYCSECMTYVNEYFNYCPHCGAKMESEE